MKRREAQTLGSILRRFLRDEGLETPLNEHRAVQAWPLVAGPAIAKATASVSIRNAVLYVRITRPALRQDLMMGHTILAGRINEHVGAHVVERIVFC